MQIIPVIDLKNGIVVHARQGNRDNYAPLKSELCKSADIFAVLDAYRTLYRFPAIYIADLNSITRQGDNTGLLAEVLTAFPDISFWIDGGYPLCAGDLQQLANFLPVLGSESILDGNIPDIINFGNDFILSLDYSATGELGAKSLFSNPELWPEHMIIMSLSRVGGNRGPDLDRLAAYRKRYPRQKIIAAGGIRDSRDLTELGRIGIRQVLVATALHNGRISPHDMASLSAKKYPG